MEKFISDDRIHEGHRGRMRAKLLTHGQQIFDTYELLEMLLYTVVPYKDTNPISKRLLAACGGLDQVFNAETSELITVTGVGERTADFISLVGGLSDVIGSELLPDNNLGFQNYQSVGEYLVKYFSPYDKNVVAALFLDNRMRLIGIKKLYDLDFESGGVKARPFVDEAIRRCAAVVITAHNHPFGTTKASIDDINISKHFSMLFATCEIGLLDHYIVAGQLCDTVNFEL